MGRKRKLENRDAILKASYHLFMTRGYDNVSVLDIEKKSSVHTRSFYRYFKNKDEILGSIIEIVEQKMMDYLQPVITDDPILTFVLFSVIKQEYAVINPDYFRMRASFISRPDTFIKSFMALYERSYPQTPEWKSSESTLLQGLYILGGMLLIQYAFINNATGNILSPECIDFMTNYDIRVMSQQTADTYRRYMDYAIRNDLQILNLSSDKIDVLLDCAYSKIDSLDIHGFQAYYERELGFSEA